MVRQLVDDQAVRIDRHRHDLGTGRREAGQRGWIAWIFDGGHVAGTQRDAGDQIERVLRALRHDHLIPVAHHRAIEAKIARDGKTQFGLAGRFAISAGTARLRPHGLIDAAAPDVEWERRLVRLAADEIVRQSGHRPR